MKTDNKSSGNTSELKRLSHFSENSVLKIICCIKTVTYWRNWMLAN